MSYRKRPRDGIILSGRLRELIVMSLTRAWVMLKVTYSSVLLPTTEEVSECTSQQTISAYLLLYILSRSEYFYLIVDLVVAYKK